MKPFKIFLIYHSHIDIGYTERQEKMAVYQADFIKQAVEYALSERQESRDEKSRFRFSAEGFWAVEQYLKRYGEPGKQRLIEAVKKGYFELTGGYLHLAELLNYQNLTHTLDYAAEFVKENYLAPIRTAMSCDVNGFSWGFADALYEHGIRCLSTCINTHHGDAPFSRPLVPFWWQSPKGNKILVWNGLSYHKANQFGLIPGFAPGGDPGVPGMKSVETSFVEVHDSDYAYQRIRELIKATKENGYPYDFMPMMGSGLYTDNSPGGDEHCELIAEFNRKYEGEIEIVTATVEQFFEHLMKYGGEFSTYSGDWNDWWTDGVLSTPNETRVFRNAQRIEMLTRKLDPEMELVTREEHEEIQNRLITYAEHTWGHSASYSDPYKLLVTQLEQRKAKLAMDADVLACSALDKIARELGEGEFTHRRPFTYTVVNPHDFEKCDVIYLPTDFWEDANFVQKGFRVEDEEGNILPSQRTSTMRGSMIACYIEMRPHEKKQLKLVFAQEIFKRDAFLRQTVEEQNSFENEFYKVCYGTDGVTSLVYRENGEELLDSKSPGLGEPVYQVFPNGNRWQAAGFGYSSRTKPASEIHRASVCSVELVESGEVFTHIKTVYKIEGAVEAMSHCYLYNHLPKLTVTAEIAKSLVRDPEGMYISLPLKVRDGEWHLDKAGAFFKPGEQLPEGCCDYYPVNRGLVLSGTGLGVAVNMPDTPMLMIHGLKLWDYTRKADRSGTIYSWLCNNKWDTNFRTQCAGYLESRYTIEIGKEMSCAENGLQVLESNEYEILVLRN